MPSTNVQHADVPYSVCALYGPEGVGSLIPWFLEGTNKVLASDMTLQKPCLAVQTLFNELSRMHVKVSVDSAIA